MEMHSRQSLDEIHGISVARRRRRSRLTARLLIARIFTFPTKVKRAIEAELAARRAIAELADMNDLMLRDLGIARSEIESTVRRPRAKIGTNDAPVFSNDTGESHPVSPVINSPEITSGGDLLVRKTWGAQQHEQ